jgi:hypothetical protein
VFRHVIAALVTMASASAVGTAAGAASPATLAAPSSSEALQAVTDAAAATSRGTGSVSVRLVPGTVYGQRQPTVRGTGTFDFAAGEGRIELRESSGREKVLFVPQAIFVREPPPVSGASPLPAGKPWVSASLSEKPGAGSGLPQFVNQVEAVNAGFVLDEIKWGAIAAKPLGVEQVSPTKGREYRVTLDLHKAQSSATGSAAPTFSQVVGYQVASLSSKSKTTVEVRAHVWVAETGRVVQVEWSPPGSGVGTTSISVSGLHAPVQVSQPPTSQTVDVATLSPAGEQESGLGDIA